MDRSRGGGNAGVDLLISTELMRNTETKSGQSGVTGRNSTCEVTPEFFLTDNPAVNKVKKKVLH